MIPMQKPLLKALNYWVRMFAQLFAKRNKAMPYDPLAHLVGKYHFDKITNVAMTHNDIYDQ